MLCLEFLYKQKPSKRQLQATQVNLNALFSMMAWRRIEYIEIKRKNKKMSSYCPT